MTIRNMVLTAAILILVLPAWSATPPVPATPAAVNAVIHSQHFMVEDGFPYTWRAERPVVREGTILVLQVDTDLFRPRQAAEPVLYAGRHTAWRVSPYNEDGIVVAFVPARIDPRTEPIWFGTPELPERVDAAAVEREQALAVASGIGPLESGAVRFHDEVLVLAGRSELLHTLHNLVLEHVRGSGGTE